MQIRIRRYGDRDVARVRFIKSAQRIGFTLQEVSQLLRLDDGTHCTEAKEIAEHKLGEIQHRLADLKRKRPICTVLTARREIS